MKNKIILACLLGILLAFGAWAQEKPKNNPNTITPPAKEEPINPDPKQQSEIEILIKQLGNDKIETRENAQSKLAKIGEPALKLLKDALKETNDLEVKRRLKVIIPQIESVIVTNLMTQYWTASDKQDIWFQFTKVAKVGIHPQGKGYCHFITKEDKYNGEPSLKIEDSYIAQNAYTRVETSIISFLSKDKPFSPLAVSVKISDTPTGGAYYESKNIEGEFKNGRLKIIDGNDKIEASIPSKEFICGNIAVRYLSVMNPDTEKIILNTPILWVFGDIMLTTLKIDPKGKQELLIGKDKINAFKFKATGTMIEAQESKMKVVEKIPTIYFWLNENKQLIKLETENAEIEIKQVSKKEAEEGISSLKND